MAAAIFILTASEGDKGDWSSSYGNKMSFYNFHMEVKISE